MNLSKSVQLFIVGHGFLVSAYFTLITYNLPNNCVGPNYRVGGRFLRY